MSVWQIGSVELPGDMEWIDEFLPSRKQVETPSLAGGVLLQRSTQVSGKPVTLQTPEGAYVSRQVIMDLTDMLDNPAIDDFEVNHPDGRTMVCRFRYGSGLPVDWANTWFRSPPQPDDYWHTLTLRLMTV